MCHASASSSLFNYGQSLCNKLTHDFGVWGCIAPHGLDVEVPYPAPAAVAMQSQML